MSTVRVTLGAAGAGAGAGQDLGRQDPNGLLAAKVAVGTDRRRAGQNGPTPK